MYISSNNQHARRYLPGLERISAYKSVWLKYWNEFNLVYPGKYENIFGPIDEEKNNEVRKLTACGRFSNGFHRHKCPECGTVLIVPFTCKSRLCLSCARKRLYGWSLNLSL
ncbi:MAG TPA: transposase zinc-binding domain-containing protein, partial [Spirochaetota bacterium]|nr:transposase zinc-binding domain-containing protein [Spirochaetota bacterium]